MADEGDDDWHGPTLYVPLYVPLAPAKADPEYWLAIELFIQYHLRVMAPRFASTSLRTHRSLQLSIHWMVLCGLSLTAAAYPLVVEIDPWHGHVLVGGSNRPDRILALLEHRHTYPGAHTLSEVEDPGGSVVLSVAERVMLASLASLASEAALVPAFAVPLLMLFLALPLGWSSLPNLSRSGLPPPSPPPRLFS